MGRKEKGKLDILVMDKDDKAYLMIECKTWGDEYEKEKKKIWFEQNNIDAIPINSKIIKTSNEIPTIIVVSKKISKTNLLKLQNSVRLILF